MIKLHTSYLQQIQSPDPNSHKGQNGVLYIAAGSRQYHGSLWFAIEAASHFVDLIYIDTDATNLPLIKQLKRLHPAIILVPPRHRKAYLEKSDCILLGPGLGRSAATQRLVTKILQHPSRPSKVVIDADALYYIDPSTLGKNAVLTPHAGEYRAIFGSKKPEIITKGLQCIVVKKGPQTLICQNGKCRYNTHGSAGLTKGGTGDVLAGMIGGLMAQGYSAFDSAVSGVYIHGLAADILREKGRDKGMIATDLLGAIPEALNSVLTRSKEA